MKKLNYRVFGFLVAALMFLIGGGIEMFLDARITDIEDSWLVDKGYECWTSYAEEFIPGGYQCYVSKASQLAYLIQNINDFGLNRLEIYLEADIDLKGVLNEDSSAGDSSTGDMAAGDSSSGGVGSYGILTSPKLLWSPINAANIDILIYGNEFTIRNLTSREGGLFSNVNSIEVHDLNMENVSIYTDSASGYNSSPMGAIVSDCSSFCYFYNVVLKSGAIRAVNNYVGGFVGSCNGDGHFEYCFNGIDVTGCSSFTNYAWSQVVGGFVGCSGYSCYLRYCTNVGKISALVCYAEISTLAVGGFVGYTNSTSGSYDNCYNFGDVEINLLAHPEVLLCGGIVGSTSGNMFDHCAFQADIKIFNLISEWLPPDICWLGGIVGGGHLPSLGDASVDDFDGSIESSYSVYEIYCWNCVTYEEMVPTPYIRNGSCSVYNYYELVVRTNSITNEAIGSDGPLFSGGGRKVTTSELDEGVFAFSRNINGGLPFLREMFAIGEFIDCECNPADYLADQYGFERI